DGRVDAVLGDPARGEVAVLLNQRRAGSFDTPVRYPVATGISSMAVADLDRDGAPEILVTSLTEGNLFILHNSGSGTFGDLYSVTPTPELTTVAAADLDGNTYPEIVAAGPGVMYVLRDSGGLHFDAAHSFPLSHDRQTVAIADMNGDGKPDVVVGGV